jgi:hypothetical protein
MRSRKTDFQCLRLGWFALSLAALLASPAFAAPPSQSPSDASQRPVAMQSNGPSNGAFEDGDGNVKATALPWSQLNPTQRSMLAPLRSQWDQLPPRRQQRMAGHAEQWMQLPPERRAQIQQRMARWVQMTPEQRRDAMHGGEAFRAMPEADRQRVLDAYQHFKSLSPEQRRLLMQRFREERRVRQGENEQGQRPPPQR